MFRRKVRRVRRRRKPSAAERASYLQHKELARELVLARLVHYNQHYNVAWNRVAIRTTRTRWGSCSSQKNLNFNYKIMFLPTHLQDYIIVHELCHLQELNHGAQFWELVAEQSPDYKQHIAELKSVEREIFLRQVRTKQQ